MCVGGGGGRAWRQSTLHATLPSCTTPPLQVAAAAAARRGVSAVVSGALSLLTYRGYFADPVRAAVSTGVLPGIFAAVEARVGRAAAAASSVDALLGGALSAGAAVFAARVAADEEARRPYLIKVYVKLPPALAAGLAPGEAVVGGGAVPTIAEAEVEDDEEEDEDEGDGGGGGAVSPRKARRLAAAGGSAVVVVGPVAVTRRDTVAAVEQRVFEWIETAAAAAGETQQGGGAGSSSSMARVLELSLGRPLHLYLRGARLPESSRLLDWPLDQLADLELRPDPDAAATLATGLVSARV